MSVKEQIIEQLELLPETMLVQIYELIQIFKRTLSTNRGAKSSQTDAISDDPLIGLFAGSSNLATNSEAILSEEIDPQSGWTWKSQS